MRRAALYARVHKCKATPVQSVPVTHSTVKRYGKAWRKFDLKGHLTATSAYAWVIADRGSDKRRFFAVLHHGLVASSLEAVRAAIIAEDRS
jgi:hypothetical protein